MQPETILRVQNLTKMFGALAAVDQVSFSLKQGHTKGLIGPNGAGKTTLINCLSGTYNATDGSVILDGEDITEYAPNERAKQGLGRTFQITNLFEEFTVAENVRLASQIKYEINFDLWSNYEEHNAPIERTDRLLKKVGLTDSAAQKVSTLSHGKKRQLEIAVALAIEPEILLLDEPTAGMATENVSDLLDLLVELKNDYSIILIEHNMDVVMEISDSIMVMNQGELIADARPSEIRNNPDVRRAYLGTTAEDVSGEA